jgi:YD repeat-containing protein
VFEPLSGTSSTLTQSDFGPVRISGGDLIDLTRPGDEVDPQNYQLTTADGYVYDLEQGFNIRKVTEPSGQSLTFTSGGVQHSTGASVSFTRDANGNISAITLPDATQITYEYDAEGNLTAHKDQLANSTTFAYDDEHGLVDILDPRGVRVTRNEYDESGRLIAQTDADGKRIEFTHNIGSNTEIVKNRRGFTQVFSYDGMGNILAETNGAGETTTRSYDDNFNELSRTDALGNTNLSTYDARRNQLSETDALGNVTRYTYNANSKPLTITSPDGSVGISNVYDAKDQLTALTNAWVKPQTSLTARTPTAQLK